MPTATTIQQCNGTNPDYQYTDPSTGSQYVVQCNQTYNGVVGASIYEPTMQGCINACSANPQCLGVAYNNATGECDEYYAYTPGSGTGSSTKTFAQMKQRAVVYGNGQTTTIPISTSYVPAESASTPSVISTPVSSVFSIYYTPSVPVYSSAYTGTPQSNQPAALGFTTSEQSATYSPLSSSQVDATISAGPTVPTSSTPGFSSKSLSESPAESSSASVSAMVSSDGSSGPTPSSSSAGQISSPIPTSGPSSDAVITTSSTPADFYSDSATATQEGSSTSVAATLSPSSTVCPQYDGQVVQDPDGSDYYVQCDTAYNGTVMNPSSSMHRVRQAGYTLLECTNACNDNIACVGLIEKNNHCYLFNNITNFLPSDGGTAALPLARVAIVPGSNSVAAITSLPAYTGTPQTYQVGGPSLTTTSAPSTAMSGSPISVPNSVPPLQTSSSATASTTLPISSPSESSTTNQTSSAYQGGLGSPTSSNTSNSVNIVTVFVTPSTCSAPWSLGYGTTTTYTTVTVTALPSWSMTTNGSTWAYLIPTR